MFLFTDKRVLGRAFGAMIEAQKHFHFGSRWGPILGPSGGPGNGSVLTTGLHFGAHLVAPKLGPQNCSQTNPTTASLRCVKLSVSAGVSGMRAHARCNPYFC